MGLKRRVSFILLILSVGDANCVHADRALTDALARRIAEEYRLALAGQLNESDASHLHSEVIDYLFNKAASPLLQPIKLYTWKWPGRADRLLGGGSLTQVDLDELGSGYMGQGLYLAETPFDSAKYGVELIEVEISGGTILDLLDPRVQSIMDHLGLSDSYFEVAGDQYPGLIRFESEDAPYYVLKGLDAYEIRTKKVHLAEMSIADLDRLLLAGFHDLSDLDDWQYDNDDRLNWVVDVFNEIRNKMNLSNSNFLPKNAQEVVKSNLFTLDKNGLLMISATDGDDDDFDDCLARVLPVSSFE